MFFCGKKIDFLLYTLLGRSILVLSIIGLTLFNKYAGIIATIIITILYNTNDYKEGLTNAHGSEIKNPAPFTNIIYGAPTFSSPAGFLQDDDDNDGEELTTQGQGPTELSNILV
jgi:hypothetical protein